MSEFYYMLSAYGLTFPVVACHLLQDLPGALFPNRPQGLTCAADLERMDDQDNDNDDDEEGGEEKAKEEDTDEDRK